MKLVIKSIMPLRTIEEWTLENGKAICNRNPLYSSFRGMDMNDGKAFLHALEEKVNQMMFMKAFWIK